MTRRLLLDVSSLMYRAFFALGDTIASPKGEPIGAVHGYLDMVARLVAQRKPAEIVHAYDHDWRPVARTEIYPGYKAGRAVDPEGLPAQFEVLKTVLERTGMTQIQTRGWEAEDAIGAFCADARPDDRFEIVSGDRDLIQLVHDPEIKLLFTVRGVSDLYEFDEAGVLAKYGVPAARYVEFAILRGDPSDALPGVNGVGEKTAFALVQTYGSLDLMLEAAAGEPQEGPLVKPALRAKLLAAADYLHDMERLVPVNIDAPLDLWGGERDDGVLKELADDLGIRGPVQRLLAALDSVGS
ncbi:MAG: 5'-3' exonuclease H3TH domain-containing protein [Actinomycetota bacterium]